MLAGFKIILMRSLEHTRHQFQGTLFDPFGLLLDTDLKLAHCLPANIPDKGSLHIALAQVDCKQ